MRMSSAALADGVVFFDGTPLSRRLFNVGVALGLGRDSAGVLVWEEGGTCCFDDVDASSEALSASLFCFASSVLSTLS